MAASDPLLGILVASACAVAGAAALRAWSSAGATRLPTLLVDSEVRGRLEAFGRIRTGEMVSVATLWWALGAAAIAAVLALIEFSPAVVVAYALAIALWISGAWAAPWSQHFARSAPHRGRSALGTRLWLACGFLVMWIGNAGFLSAFALAGFWLGDRLG